MEIKLILIDRRVNIEAGVRAKVEMVLLPKEFDT